MLEYHAAETATLVIHLNELKSKFDRELMDGKNFADVKKIYMQIKEIESQLNVMNWQARRS